MEKDVHYEIWPHPSQTSKLENPIRVNSYDL